MEQDWPKVIVHVDMDAFFAAVEQLLHPEWKGKPVIVGADPREGRGRGVVSTASYEARQFGIHSAMPISQAYRLCPHGIYIRPHGEIYAQYSRQIMQILAEFTPRIQAVSIDEAFLDVSGSVHLFGTVENLAREIKRRIFQQTQLTASIGVAPSKSVAKIASDFQKPDGLTIVPPEEVLAFLEPLPVRKIWGVGEKTYQRLQHLGIETIGQLRQYPLRVLQQTFGKMGTHLYGMARGEDERDLELDDEIKSVSHETTFDVDETQLDVLDDVLFNLSEKVGRRLRKYRLKGKTIQLKLRFSDFSTFTRSHTLGHYTNLTEDIYRVGHHLLQEFQQLPQPVRLLGIGVSHLVDESGVQLSLWDLENEKKLQLEKIMDQLQEKYGALALTHARTLGVKQQRKGK